ncbi:unnamed protein product [Orchesella dallaii]|uniref:O-acyltransferase WSD1 C-terminal domain-containing protein n=1 Tax=Orchesella dallaii TaxID=48710 RepID=A0ABP1R9T9_9HEXA
MLPTKDNPISSAYAGIEQGGGGDATYNGSTNPRNNKLNNFSSSRESEGNNVNNNSQENSSNGGVGVGNKILNILNSKNNFLTSYKLSEDEIFSDLKSRFIEKHFRTILRSQGKPDNNNGGGVGGVSGKSDTNANRECAVGVGLSHNNHSNNPNPLKIITVQRPEPQLDLPRDTYFKSTRAKLFKMHEQAKARVVERYRKLCATLTTSIWPQLKPLQVFLEVVLSNIAMLIVAPFAICSVMILCLVRLCIGAILKLRYKGRFHLMSGSDAAWAHQYYANDSCFLNLFVIQGDCSIARIRERIMKSVINCQDPQYPGKFTYSRLRSRITEKFGFYCWETLHPMDFCIDEHVRYITNDPSAVLTQDQVLREIQKFMDEPLPTDQPQWQILVVPKFLYNRDNDYFANHDILEDDGFGNFDTITVKKPQKGANYFYGNNYYALVWRINHSLMDGISASNCLQHCISDMPAKLSIDPLQRVPVPFHINFVMYFNMLIFGSRSLLRSMLQRDLNCFHGPALAGPKTLAWTRRINLDSVKTIKRRNETTMTAVLASSVGSALRGLAIRKNNPVPTEIRSGVTCALLPYPNIRPQNRFTVAHLKLRLDPESSKERLQFATKSAKRLVRSGDIYKNYGLIRIVGLMPKNAIPWLMDNCEATVIISNIPGPTEEYTIFQGQKLVDVIAWNTIKGSTGKEIILNGYSHKSISPIFNFRTNAYYVLWYQTIFAAIGVCIFSYAGRIRAGVIGDGAVLPSSSDVPSLVEELEKEIVHMAKEADIKEKDVFMQVY